MGLMTLRVTVANVADPDRSQSLDFLLDSGMNYSIVPAKVLDELGIKPITTQEFRLADGSSIHRPKGAALFRYGDRISGADVIFGEEHDHVFLGAFALASFGFVLHPLRRELLPLPMILAAHGIR